MSRQIGQFFFFIGLITLVIFCATAYADMPAYSYCVGGFIPMALGLFLMFRGYKPPPPNQARFRILRKQQDKQKSNKG